MLWYQYHAHLTAHVQVTLYQFYSEARSIRTYTPSCRWHGREEELQESLAHFQEQLQEASRKMAEAHCDNVGGFKTKKATYIQVSVVAEVLLYQLSFVDVCFKRPQ